MGNDLKSLHRWFKINNFSNSASITLKKSHNWGIIKNNFSQYEQYNHAKLINVHVHEKTFVIMASFKNPNSTCCHKIVKFFQNLYWILSKLFKGQRDIVKIGR